MSEKTVQKSLTSDWFETKLACKNLKSNQMKTISMKQFIGLISLGVVIICIGYFLPWEVTLVTTALGFGLIGAAICLENEKD